MNKFVEDMLGMKHEVVFEHDVEEETQTIPAYDHHKYQNILYKEPSSEEYIRLEPEQGFYFVDGYEIILLSNGKFKPGTHIVYGEIGSNLDNE